MNAARRKQIAAIVSEMQALNAQFEDLKERMECARDEEQEYFDNMPESFQSGDKGQVAEAAISALDSAIDDMPDLDEIIGYLEEAGQ